MPATNLLGVAFTILATNFSHTDIQPMFCPVPGCTNTHHYRLIDVERVTKETKVYVLPEGETSPVARTLDKIPFSRIMVTNYVTDLRAAQSRGRVPPLPLVPGPP